MTISSIASLSISEATPSSYYYYSNTFTASAGSIVLAFVGVVNHKNQLSSVTSSNYTWTRLTAENINGDGGNGAGKSQMEVWWTYAETSYSSETLNVLTDSTDDAKGFVCSILQISGSFGKNVVASRQYKWNQGSFKSALLTLSRTTLTTSGVISFAMSFHNSILSEPSGFTYESISDTSVYDLFGGIAYVSSGATTTNLNWVQSGDSRDYGVFGIEIWNPYVFTNPAYNSPMTY